MKLTSILLLIIGGLPLLAYPFIVISNIMLYSGLLHGTDPAGQLIVDYLLIISTSIYPLVYGLCLYFAVVRMKRGKKRRALNMSIYPIGYIAILIILFEIGSAFGLT